MFTKPTNGAYDYPTQVGRLIDLAEGPARRNFIRNGDFMVAQRGTSFAGITAAQYTLDGVYFQGSAGTNTITQETFTVGQTDVPDNPRNFLRVARTVAAGAANSIIQFPIEFPARLSGKTVTVSFRAKVSSGTKALVFDLASSGVTSSVDTSDNSFTATTTWTPFSASIAVPAMTAATSSAYLALRIREAASFGTFTLDIADVQLEEGSEATRFERLGYGDQLRWCQRFLPAKASQGTNHIIGTGMCYATNGTKIVIPFTTRARIAVTGISVSNATHLSVQDASGNAVAGTTATFNRGGDDACEIVIAVSSGLVAGSATNAFFNSASGTLVFTGAEL